VNLIGEHTDYNEGFVLRLAIDRATVVAWAPRDDAVLRVLAVNAAGAIDTVSLETDIQRSQPRPAQRGHPWPALVGQLLQLSSERKVRASRRFRSCIAPARQKCAGRADAHCGSCR